MLRNEGNLTYVPFVVGERFYAMTVYRIFERVGTT
jgi:hypothetical protein